MNKDKGLFDVFTTGMWRENTILKLLIGMCPTLAVSNSAINALAMGLASTFVVISSSAFISAIRKLVPDGVRIPAYIVVISAFVTLADLFLRAYFPPISKALGPYVPLIVVNCMIMARAEIFASRNSPMPSVLDAMGSGIGFTWVLIVVGSIREILGSGSIFGLIVMTEETFTPWVVMLLPAGAFLTLGSFIGVVNHLTATRKRGETGGTHLDIHIGGHSQ